ncbi:hypothetical protein DFJ73DRAFT_956356 [Zopfochytrium polystomum]|nr:hypothetical protein DFJ73DRAFT_956356 [Zopfochytrium polystomum]
MTPPLEQALTGAAANSGDAAAAAAAVAGVASPWTGPPPDKSHGAATAAATDGPDDGSSSSRTAAPAAPPAAAAAAAPAFSSTTSPLPPPPDWRKAAVAAAAARAFTPPSTSSSLLLLSVAAPPPPQPQPPSTAPTAQPNASAPQPPLAAAVSAAASLRPSPGASALFSSPAPSATDLQPSRDSIASSSTSSSGGGDGGGGARKIVGASSSSSSTGASSSPKLASRSVALEPSQKLQAAGKAVLAVTSVSSDARASASARPAGSAAGGGGGRYKNGVTPAQALTRLTGKIFDRDSDLPGPLQAPLVAAVNAYDAAVKVLRATRGAVDGLVYWEAFISTLGVVAAVVLAFLCGMFGIGILPVFCLAVTVGGFVTKNWKTIKDRLTADELRTVGLKRIENDSESVEWLNRFLFRLWTHMEPSLSDSIKASINASLASAKPAFLDDLSVAVFTLGSASPRIEHIRTIARTADDVHLMDWDINLTPVDESMRANREKSLGDPRQSKIEIVAKAGKGVTAFQIPIVAGEFEFKGKLRVGLKFMSKYPHIKAVEYSFLETPKIDLILRPLKALDLFDTPGLQTFVNDVIASSLSSYVEPHKNIFDMESFFAGPDADVVKGVLRVTLYEARNLKNVELAGVSDPYVVVKIGGKEVARTSIIDGNLNPFWGESYFIPISKDILDPIDPITAARADELKFELYDHNETLKHKFMGSTSGLPLSKWITILDESNQIQPAAKTEAENDSDADLKRAASVLSDIERDALLSGWGTPFAEQSDVWRPLILKDDQSGSSDPVSTSIVSKTRGELRFDMAFFPLSSTSSSAPAAKPAAPAESAAGEGPTPMAPSSEEAAAAAAAAAEAEEKLAAEARRAAHMASLTTGVLTVTVHQAKELPCGKSGCPQATVELFGVVQPPTSPSPVVGTTPTIKKTNNPVWDVAFPIFISDSAAANLRIILRDTRDGSLIGEAAVYVREVINLPAAVVPVDWFKLGASTTGKLRVTFKWQPLDMESSQGDKSKVRRKEPAGLVRVKIIEAKGVANVETFRKSDPYCMLLLGNAAFGTTHVKDNTLDPVWNETFFTPLYSASEALRIELWDSNNVKKDRTLGRVDMTLKDIMEIANSGVYPSDSTLLRSKTDGLKIRALGDNLFDVFAPIYIHKGAEDEAENAKDLSRKTLTLIDRTGNAPRQKGYLQFELELFKVVSDFYIRPETQTELASKQQMLDVAETELRRLKLLVDVGVIKTVEGEEVPEKIREAEKVLQALSVGSPSKVLQEHPSGIIRLRIHRAVGLTDPLTSYIDVLISDEPVFQTRPQRRTASPSWDALGDLFIRDALTQEITLQLRTAVKDEGAKTSPDDPALAEWSGKLLEIVGKQGENVSLKTAKGSTMAELVVSAGYAPISASFSNQTTKNTGVLFLDIVEANHLEAVDSGGTSDPYCVVSLGPNVFYKSKTIKKNLNPTFNESCMALVRSRLRETLTITVRDYNAIGRHTTLGTVSLQLSQLKPGELYQGSLPLEGARGGVLQVRILFDSRPETWNSIKSELGVGDGDVASVFSGGTTASDAAAATASSKTGAISALLSGGKSKSVQTQQASRKSAYDRAMLMGWPVVPLAGAVSVSKEPFGSPRSRPINGTSGSPIRDAHTTTRDIGEPHTTADGTLTRTNSNSSTDHAVEFGAQAAVGAFAINIVEARELKPVDAGGTSDPFVVVTQLLHGKSKVLHKTRVMKKTLNPHWPNESLIVKVPPSKVSFIVKDFNLLSESKPLGEVSIDLFTLLPPLLGTPAGGTTAFDVWLPVGVGGTGELRLKGEWRDASASPPSSLSSSVRRQRRSVSASSTSLFMTTALGSSDVPPVPSMRPSLSAGGGTHRSSPASQASSMSDVAGNANGGSSPPPPLPPMPPMPPSQEKEKRRWFSRH